MGLEGSEVFMVAWSRQKILKDMVGVTLWIPAPSLRHWFACPGSCSPCLVFPLWEEVPVEGWQGQTAVPGSPEYWPANGLLWPGHPAVLLRCLFLLYT